MTTPTLTILKKTWRLAFALSFSRLINMITSFVGVLMVARLGHNELAASALIITLQATIFVVSISFLFSIGAVIGHAFGAKRYQEIGCIVRQGLLLATIITIPVIIIILNIGPLLTLFKQSPKLVVITTHYFWIYLFAIPAFLWMIALQQFVLAINQQRFVLLMSVFSLVVSITSAYTLIYGHFGFPKFGVNGLAIAITIQAWLSLFIYLAFCYFNQRFKDYQIFRWHWRGTFHLLGQLFKIGWPISLQTAGDFIAFSAITIMVGWLGSSELATRQIVSQYFMLLVVPIFAISQASAILVGQARGAEDIHDIKRYGDTTLLVGLGFSAIVIILFVFFPHTLVNLYIGKGHELSQHYRNLAVIILILTGFRLFFDAGLEITTGNLRGLYDTKIPMLIGIGSTWLIGIPLAYLFGFHFHWGLIGITCASVVLMLISASITYWRWLWQCRQLINKH